MRFNAALLHVLPGMDVIKTAHNKTAKGPEDGPVTNSVFQLSLSLHLAELFYYWTVGMFLASLACFLERIYYQKVRV